MTILRICRGLPASGKTTHALEWLAEDRERRARVNRDDLRAMLHDSVYLGSVTENVIIAAEKDLIVKLLVQGISVIIDDTNLDPAVVRGFTELALAVSIISADGPVQVQIADFRDVSLEECISRNAAREKAAPVPEEAIRRMHAQWLAVS